ncbi:MAG: hypothetical protein ACYTEK_18660, partial [Planctomycetota bacterium]
MVIKRKQPMRILLVLLFAVTAGVPAPAAIGQVKTTGLPGSRLLDECLAGPMADVDEIIFACRQLNYDGHWYANFGYYADNAER